MPPAKEIFPRTIRSARPGLDKLACIPSENQAPSVSLHPGTGMFRCVPNQNNFLVSHFTAKISMRFPSSEGSVNPPLSFGLTNSVKHGGAVVLPVVHRIVCPCLKLKQIKLKQRRICTMAQITRAPHIGRCCDKAVVGFLSQGFFFLGIEPSTGSLTTTTTPAIFCKLMHVNLLVCISSA